MTLTELCTVAHGIALSKGFWNDGRNDAECIALMHSELSEALEALRGIPAMPSQVIPEFTALEEELADLQIRLADYCGGRHLDLEGAVQAKLAYNRTRPRMHGKAF